MNLRKQVNVRLVTDKARAKRLTAKPTFDSFHIISDKLTVVKMRKAQIFWNKPTYAGFAILDLSKVHMYKFHYEYMLPRYGRRVALLFTDTDSLAYEIRTDDWYEDMRRDLDWFDTSDYPKDNPCYSDKNCKVLGKFKDECCSKIPIQFIGLKAKMYSLKLQNETQKNTAKGVKTTYVKKHLPHDKYLNCYNSLQTLQASFYAITSKKHQLSTSKINKIGLNPFDDKRYLLPNDGNTLAYGHYALRGNACSS